MTTETWPANEVWCVKHETLENGKRYTVDQYGAVRCTDEDKDWENDGDPCNDCGEPAAYEPGVGWYYHIDPNAPACFLMGSGPQKTQEPPRVSTS